MDLDNVALGHLVDSITEIHENSKMVGSIDENIEYVDFKDDEIKRFIAALWIDRYSSSREGFKNEVSKSVSDRI